MSQVQLSDELYAQLEKIVQDSQEFSDVASYVEYILKQVVEKKQKATETAETQAGVYSKEDEDKIRDRLKNLGYLD